MPSSAIQRTKWFTLWPEEAPPENWKLTKPSLHGQVIRMNWSLPVWRYEPCRTITAPSIA